MNEESVRSLNHSLEINILTAKSSWMNHYTDTLKTNLEKRGH